MDTRSLTRGIFWRQAAVHVQNMPDIAIFIDITSGHLLMALRSIQFPAESRAARSAFGHP
jgi:hypothetical protein